MRETGEEERREGGRWRTTTRLVPLFLCSAGEGVCRSVWPRILEKTWQYVLAFRL